MRHTAATLAILLLAILEEGLLAVGGITMMAAPTATPDMPPPLVGFGGSIPPNPRGSLAKTPVATSLLSPPPLVSAVPPMACAGYVAGDADAEMATVARVMVRGALRHGGVDSALTPVVGAVAAVVEVPRGGASDRLPRLRPHILVPPG